LPVFWLQDHVLWSVSVIDLVCWLCFLRAGYTSRKFLYKAHLQEETSCNSNVWQSEWGFALVFGWPQTSVWMKCNPLLILFRRKWVSCLVYTYKGQKIYRVLRNCYSWRPYVHNCVKWPEHKSEHKTLYNVEITCRAIILSLYMTVRSI